MTQTSRIDFEVLQSRQQKHDELAHADILRLPLQRRLTHFTLHFAKYQGQLVGAVRRGTNQSLDRAVVDSMIILLAMANALELRLEPNPKQGAPLSNGVAKRQLTKELLNGYIEIVGRMAKACESLDHMEDYPSREVMEISARDLVQLILALSMVIQLDLVAEISNRWVEVEAKVASKSLAKSKAASLTEAA